MDTSSLTIHLVLIKTLLHYLAINLLIEYSVYIYVYTMQSIVWYDNIMSTMSFVPLSLQFPNHDLNWSHAGEIHLLQKHIEMI